MLLAEDEKTRKGPVLISSLARRGKMPQKFLEAILICVTLLITAHVSSGQSLPDPVLQFTGYENYEANGKQWVRYRYTVENADKFPEEMFAAAPDLPPCGLNTKASRTWVDLYAKDGKRLYGFCAIYETKGLKNIWFAVALGATPPDHIFIELNDRKTSQKYRSNLAATSP